MKALYIRKYGSLESLKLEEVATPSLNEDTVLVRVRAAGVNFSNVAIATGKPFIARFMGLGFPGPKFPIPGSEIAGQIEAVGKNIKRFKIGDEVYGDLSDFGRGGFAEYVAVSEKALELKPSNLSFAEAAAVPETALVALQAIRDKGKIKPGQKALIIGASGGIGTYAVQISKVFGAEVTGVCGPKNKELVRSIGADDVIDYTAEDFSRVNKTFDLIIATAGKYSIDAIRRALSPTGAYVATGGAMSQIMGATLLGPLLSRKHGKRFGSLLVKTNEGLAFMKELIETGKVKPVIDRCYPFSEIGEAFKYYASGHVKGKVVVEIS
ncbi:MAG TPA: NAD(P)-dependent alcohol dehydrogenase [Thermotogota bacterium]|nr:NAD(P)-dependent alcohol dehydrogenase [Thermotogota bacterium]HPH11434.1 NAD(P)-dependent alcohol dehydrogenase [Thermotogota bacterium]HQQ66631.1 NAD(P)-dependent alcohol dehydrogenase [Thermotogota bacterium]